MDAARTCRHSIPGVVWSCLAIVLTLTTTTGATPGEVLSHQKISDTQGGFTGTLEDDDRFGTSVASLGDLDDDGVCDLAVGSFNDGDGGFVRGAVWVLFLDGVTDVATGACCMPVNGAGKAQAIWTGQAGLPVICVAECDGICRPVSCP